MQRFLSLISGHTGEKVFDGHLGCLHVLAIINSAAMNIGEHVSLSDLVSLVCMPRSGIAGSYGSSSSVF